MTAPTGDTLAEACPSCQRDLSYPGAPGHECYTHPARRHSLDEEMAVVIAALLAGRIDGQQALASATSTARAHIAAVLADPETVEAVEDGIAEALGVVGGHVAARAALRVIAARLGVTL